MANRAGILAQYRHEEDTANILAQCRREEDTANILPQYRHEEDTSSAEAARNSAAAHREHIVTGAVETGAPVT
jgi:hypothetical protein